MESSAFPHPTDAGGGDPVQGGAAGAFADIFAQFDTLFEGRGADVRHTLEISSQEAATGGTKVLALAIAVPCGRCEESGAEPGTARTPCPQCHGRGEVRRTQQSACGPFVNVTTCAACRGTGRGATVRCHACGGQGSVATTRRVSVVVPPGATTGARLQLRGQGQPGRRGGAAGDLEVVLHVTPATRD